jgi:hypothetical protein
MNARPGRFRSALVFLGFSLLLACGDESPVQVPVAEAPAELSPSTPVSRTLPGKPDSASAISVTFHADSGTTYTLKVKGIRASDSLFILDEQGRRPWVTALPFQSGGDSVTIQFPALSTGMRTLRIVAPGGSVVQVTESVKSGLPSTVIPPDQREPDSTRNLAHAVTVADGWIKGTLHTGTVPDQDWFRLETDSGWTYKVEVMDSVKMYASSLEVFGSDSATVIPLAYGSATWPSFGKGTFRIRVSGTDNSGVRYRIRITRTAGVPVGGYAADGWESDDSRVTAKSIPTDSTVQARTLHGWQTTSDVDWITFPVDSGKTYVIRLSHDFKSLAPLLWTGDSTSKRLGSIATKTGTGSVSVDTFPCVRSGKVHVQISSSTPGGYALAITSRQGIEERFVPDVGEPDNDSLHAMRVKAQQLDLVRALDGNDTDRVRLMLTGNTCHEIKLFNLDSSRAIQAKAGSMGREIPKRDSLVVRSCTFTPDSVNLLITTRAWSIDSRLRYRIMATETALPVDPLESDGSPAQAALIEPGRNPVRRWVMSGDQDWMKVPVTAGRNIALKVVSDSGKESTSWEAYDGVAATDKPQGGLLQAQQDTRTGQVFFPVAKTGFVFIHVQAGATAPVWYSVSAQDLAWDSLETLEPTPLTADSTPGQALLNDGESDAFLVRVKAGQSYAWSIRSGGAQTAFGYVFDMDKVLAGSETVPKDSNGIFTAAKDGTVRIFVENTHYQLKLASPNPAKLRVWPISNDAFEPDGTLATARALSIDGPALGGTLVSNEVDAFRLPIDTGTIVHFTLSGDNLAGAKLQLSSVNDTGRSLDLDAADAASGGGWYFIPNGLKYTYYDNAAGNWVSLKSTEAILKLSGVSGTVGNYSIRATKVTGSDAYEPDGFYSHTPSLDSVESHTLTALDVDRFTLPSTPVDTGYVMVVDCAKPLQVHIDNGTTSSSSVKITSDGTRTTYRFRSVTTTGPTGFTGNGMDIRVWAQSHVDVIPYTIRIGQE